MYNERVSECHVARWTAMKRRGVGVHGCHHHGAIRGRDAGQEQSSIRIHVFPFSFSFPFPDPAPTHHSSSYVSLDALQSRAHTSGRALYNTRGVTRAVEHRWWVVARVEKKNKDKIEEQKSF